MKPIKISTANADRIREALEAVNGRATSMTITHPRNVMSVSEEAEDQLYLLPKAQRVGATCTYTPAGPNANSYKYRAATTRISLERRATGWFLTGVTRGEVYPKQPERFDMTISQAQADEISRRTLAPFKIEREG